MFGKEVKLSLFADDMILYIENPKDASESRYNEYSKTTRYKVNIQKSLAFLHMNNEKSVREIKEAIPFIIVTTITKIPRNKPT